MEFINWLSNEIMGKPMLCIVPVVLYVFYLLLAFLNRENPENFLSKRIKICIHVLFVIANIFFPVFLPIAMALAFLGEGGDASFIEFSGVLILVFGIFSYLVIWTSPFVLLTDIVHKWSSKMKNKGFSKRITYLSLFLSFTLLYIQILNAITFDMRTEKVVPIANKEAEEYMQKNYPDFKGNLILNDSSTPYGVVYNLGETTNWMEVTFNGSQKFKDINFHGNDLNSLIDKSKLKYSEEEISQISINYVNERYPHLDFKTDEVAYLENGYYTLSFYSDTFNYISGDISVSYETGKVITDTINENKELEGINISLKDAYLKSKGELTGADYELILENHSLEKYQFIYTNKKTKELIKHTIFTNNGQLKHSEINKNISNVKTFETAEDVLVQHLISKHSNKNFEIENIYKERDQYFGMVYIYNKKDVEKLEPEYYSVVIKSNGDISEQ